MDFYTLDVAGVTRRLPLRRATPTLRIASFIMLGDTELVEACAAALAPRLPAEAKWIVAPETKAIPLAHALSRLTGRGYVILRKTRKVYMDSPLALPVKSITTEAAQELILDGTDAARIKGQPVVLVDDVVSTGGSLDAMERLVVMADARIVARAAVLLEEGGYNGDGLIYLKKLPVFPD